MCLLKYIWLNVYSCVHVGELRGAVQESMWCVGGSMHTSPCIALHAHHCFQHKGDYQLPSHQLPSVPTHSSSQVVHCRVCPPHPLHAPVLVLHLAVYPASPTQGRVGLTDRLTHSAQTQCSLTMQMKSVISEIVSEARQSSMLQYFNEIVCLCSERSSGACIETNYCYGNHFSLSCTLMFAGALILQLFFKFFLYSVSIINSSLFDLIL